MLDEELARLRTAGPAEAEMEKARNRLEAAFYADLQTVGDRARALGHFHTTLGDYRRLLREVERLRSVSSADVRRVARLYLTPHNRTAVVVTSQSTPIGGADGTPTRDPS